MRSLTSFTGAAGRKISVRGVQQRSSFYKAHTRPQTPADAATGHTCLHGHAQVRRRLPIMGPGPAALLSRPWPQHSRNRSSFATALAPLSQVCSVVSPPPLTGICWPRVNDDDTGDEDPSPTSSQKRESNAIHPWSRYFNKADKRRRRAPPALPQPQEAGVGPSGAGPSGLGPSAAAPPAAAPAQAPAADPVAPGLGCDKQQAP